MIRNYKWRFWAVVALQVGLSGLVLGAPDAAEKEALDKVWTADIFCSGKAPAQLGCVKEAKHDYATEKYNAPWDFEDGTQARIALFSPGIDQPRVEGGKLKFTMTGTNVHFAWNKEWIHFPGEAGKWADVSLKVKQSQTISQWFVHSARDGAELARKHEKSKGQCELTGTNWQTKTLAIRIPADSLQIDVAGPAGNEIEIDAVAVMTPEYVGYYRKTFDLPSDKIWKAILNLGRPGMDAQVYVNGQLAWKIEPDTSWNVTVEGKSAYYPFPLEITSLLKPGKNVIAVYASRYDYPPVFLIQGTVCLENGQRIAINTDKSWKWCGASEPDWNKIAFDDSKWAATTTTFRPMWGYLDGARPYNNGFLQIVNPSRKKLIYKDKDDIIFRVEAPAVFAGRQWPLSYTVSNLTDTAKAVALAGTVASGKVKAGILSYECPLGKLPQGVYRIQFTVGGADGAKEGLARSEKFLVVGPMAQKKVAGNSFEEGMELELEDEIDCADPKDKHLFYDSDGKVGSRIIKRGGLAYRETSFGSSYFSYVLQLKEKHALYLISVEYPDDRDRVINYSIETLQTNTLVYYPTGDKFLDWGITTPGVVCGGAGKFPHTGKMQTIKMLHMARGPETVIKIENRPDFMISQAAAGKIRVYRVKNRLPALDIPNPGQRLFGGSMERGDLVETPFGTLPSSRNRLPSKVEHLVNWYEITRNFTEYLRFSGQNLVNLGCYMYGYYVCGPKRLVDDSSLEPGGYNVMLAVFEENDIYMTAGIEYCYAQKFLLQYDATDKEVQAGADTVWSVSRQGKQYRKEVSGGPTFCVNTFHPEARKDIVRVADELLNRYKDSPAFKGLAFHLFGGIFAPSIGLDSYESGVSPLDWGYDDASLAGFEKDTGTKVPPDAKDPLRFQKRYDWLMANAKEQWIDWRCKKMFEVEQEIFRHVKQARPDLILVNNLTVYPSHVKAALKNGLTLTEYLREMGYDPQLYRNSDGLYFNRWQYHLFTHCTPPVDQYLNRLYAQDSDIIRLFDRETSRGYCVQRPFDEHGFKETNTQPWPWKYANFNGRAWCIAWPVPGHQFHNEAYVRALIESDPDMVTFGQFDSSFPVGHEQEMREFSKAFQALPKEKFRTLQGDEFNPNVVVKELRKEKDYYFYVANPGWWEETATIRFQDASPLDSLLDRVTGKKVVVKDAALTVTLAPYAVRVFSLTSEKAQVVKTEVVFPSDEVKRYLVSKVAGMQKMIDSPFMIEVLSASDRDHCRKCVDEAQGHLQRGDYFHANDRVTDGKFNQIMRQSGVCTTWQVIGPFANPENKGLDTVYPPEQEIKLDAKYPGSDGKTVGWKEARTMDGVVDLRKDCAGQEWVLGYAVAFLQCPDNRTAQLMIGSDDGVKVWVNDEMVLANNIARGYNYGEDIVPLKLKAGINKILLKVEQRLGDWKFGCDLLAPDGTPMPDVIWLKRPLL